MIRSSSVFLPALLFSLFLPPRPAGAQLFLSPQIETLAGYTSNRFLNPDQEGAGYVRASPTLGATWFAADRLEVNASLGYTHTEYLRTDFGHLAEVFANLGLFASYGRADLSCELAAGSYRDSEMVQDDSTWVQVAPSALVTIDRAWTASLSATLAHTRYSERTTGAGSDERDTYLSLRPGLTWLPGSDVTLWGELIGEANTSNEDASEFFGVGMAAGLDSTLADGIHAGAWVQWNRQEYRDPYPDSSASRTDAPLSVTAWGRARLAPWAEVSLSANWFDRNSDDALDDYREWGVVAGLRLVYDRQVLR